MATRAQREELDYVVPGDVFLFLVIINRKYGIGLFNTTLVNIFFLYISLEGVQI
jgi:hypothetical protein